MQGGNKGKYDPETTCIDVEYLARCGHNNKEIFTKIGSSHDTFCRWLKQKPEVKEALKKGRSFHLLDIHVENALKKSSEAFHVDEERTEMLPDPPSPKNAMITKKTIIKKYMKKISMIRLAELLTPFSGGSIVYCDNEDPRAISELRANLKQYLSSYPETIDTINTHLSCIISWFNNYSNNTPTHLTTISNAMIYLLPIVAA